MREKSNITKQKSPAQCTRIQVKDFVHRTGLRELLADSEEMASLDVDTVDPCSAQILEIDTIGRQVRGRASIAVPVQRAAGDDRIPQLLVGILLREAEKLLIECRTKSFVIHFDHHFFH